MKEDFEEKGREIRIKERNEEMKLERVRINLYLS